MKVRFIFFLVITLSFAACKKGTQETSIVDLDSIDISDKGKQLSALDTIGTGIPIFYNMYLSVELSSLFETAGAVYSSELLNPSDKVSNYTTSYKKAMNLGVYAVDLSYSRVFDQFEIAGKYFSSMQILSEQLGIPQNFFESTAQRFERNMTNKDSLISIANEVYYETEEYLKDNERFATASVIILGGWVEAIFIATNVVNESKNPDVIERLVEQKYSLNNLISMLIDYSDNEVVNEYITRLKDLKTVFEATSIEIPTDFVPDSPEGKKLIEKWLVDIKPLQNEITKIRTEITD
ncbi:MAG: hypothetical protein JXA77_10860 [Bacteroidales bacterium]|nr:hypothetical protein [Bacteroidales bacterium]MBN2818992.1 hypothetical protein [Bacteroidales bacterium]